MTPSLLSLFVCAATAPILSAQTALYEFVGTSTEDRVGFAMDAVGDLNSDGFTDFVWGSWASPSLVPYAGQIGAYSGRTGALLYSRVGVVPGGLFGSGIAALGDVNADAVPDYIVRSQVLHLPPQDPDYVLHVVSGTDGSTIYSLTLEPTLDDRGEMFAALGDLNQDSIPDFIIGMAEHDGPNGTGSGRFEIRSGADGSLIRARDGAATNDELGASIEGLGDVNGDSVGDYAVGAPFAGASDTGMVHVYSGADGTLIYETSGPAVPSFRMGRSLAAMGDLNADGVGEIAVGADGGSSLSGGVYVLSGADGTILLQLAGSVNGQALGQAVADAGDYNNDGTPDFATSSVGANSNTGRVTFRSGNGGAVLGTYDGPSPGSYLGIFLKGGSDIDGDGFVDIMASSHLDNGERGRVVVIKRDVPNGGTLCRGLPNSTGQRAIMTASSASQFTAAANDVTLSITQLPPNVVGLPAVSRHSIIGLFPVNSMGRICIAGQTLGRARSLVFTSSATGAATVTPDLTTLPLGGMVVAAGAGDTFNFQCWHRDVVNGSSTSNFTDAVTLTFQ